jgi:hypothetical protein
MALPVVQPNLRSAFVRGGILVRPIEVDSPISIDIAAGHIVRVHGFLRKARGRRRIFKPPIAGLQQKSALTSRIHATGTFAGIGYEQIGAAIPVEIPDTVVARSLKLGRIWA